MAYDDADNSIETPPAAYVTAEGQVLYVYDAQSGMTGDGSAYTYAEPLSRAATGRRYGVERGMAAVKSVVGGAMPIEVGDGESSPGETEVYDDSFSALFLAYDAADDSFDDFDDEEDDGAAELDDLGSVVDAWHVSRGERTAASSGSVRGRRTQEGRHAGAGWSSDVEEPARTRDADDSNAMTIGDLIAAFDEDGSLGDPVPRQAEAGNARHVERREQRVVRREERGRSQAAQSAHRVASAGSHHGAVAVDEVASDDPDARAAVAAIKARRAQSRHRRSAYAFMAAGALAVAALAVFVNYLLGLDEAVAATAGGMVSVQRADHAVSVRGTGTLSPVSAVAVSPSVAGKVDRVYVSDGDLVEAGNVLFTVVNDDVGDAARAAQAELDQANAALGRANEAVRAAYETYNTEVDSYRAGRNPNFDEAAALAAIRSAETTRDAALDAANVARSALEEANARSSARDVTAPVAGAVIGLSVKEGQEVTPSAEGADESTASLQIADISQLRVTVRLSAEEAEGVSEGQQARVSLVGLPDVASDAVVESVARQDSGALEVVLAVSKPDSRLRPGADVDVSITTSVDPNVLVVPRAAVGREGDEMVVWLVTDEATGRSERRVVSLGASDEDEAVVVEGLSEGDVVGLP